MSITAQIAKHLRDVHFGGNWTTVNLKDTLSDVYWQEATTVVHSFNTLATLLNHHSYYIREVARVLEGQPLTSKDEESFIYPPVQSAEDWESMREKAWTDAERFAVLIEKLPDSQLQQPFTDEKYGSYFRNLTGIIEHAHYHLGQMVLIKKLLR